MRDYANKSNRPAKKKSGSQDKLSNGMLILALVFAGIATFHFIDMHLLPKNKTVPTNNLIPIKTPTQNTHTEIAKPIALNKKTTTNIITNKLNTEKTQPRFDFYKLLPKMTVIVPTQNDGSQKQSNTPITSSTPKTVSASTPGAYILQVASLPKKSAAIQTQVVLKKAGYQTFIQRYQASDSSTWYRVMIGPFMHLKAAAQEQNKLAMHHVPALLLRVSK
ncbi:MAG: hypothetical protein COY58_03700 [Gammaproteobacteria bacterium CG_4_10_14_0_8_um_filter_38_16]|nr:MAG: hypothetical protein COY58_03700 [Gammaproteobacteria bacterium CG_4_10_14_0_8_um_filter_38_16]PJA03684.1 MAG: hypothetical protein COX72_04085 [Gammaproteobacteria bacterium CG_4_10_14_0_2_um_filter_38_22]PJB11349.1 MAG: hypothetical protein CO120_00890 [Gammaproteobacteria bacterium CG_4_9_14_3_um_filter_38_9]